MTVDPIVALESLGYTEREAAFLYLVGCPLRLLPSPSVRLLHRPDQQGNRPALHRQGPRRRTHRGDRLRPRAIAFITSLPSRSTGCSAMPSRRTAVEKETPRFAPDSSPSTTSSKMSRTGISNRTTNVFTSSRKCGVSCRRYIATIGGECIRCWDRFLSPWPTVHIRPLRWFASFLRTKRR